MDCRHWISMKDIESCRKEHEEFDFLGPGGQTTAGEKKKQMIVMIMMALKRGSLKRWARELLNDAVCQILYKPLTHVSEFWLHRLFLF